MTHVKENENISVVPKAQKKEWDSTFQLMSWWKKEVVKNAKVMVVGAGALGNEVLKNLALLNVGNILIVDFDHIEYSNLSRSVLFREEDCGNDSLKCDIAAERIKAINSNVKLKTINGDITIDVGLGVFRRIDVVIGCLDNRLARLSLNRACFKVNKTWIDSAIENLGGSVHVFKPGVSCYECTLTKKDWKNIKFKLGCPDIAKRNQSFGRIPTTPISSSIMAAVQVQEALKIVNGNDEQSMAGNYLYYEGMSNLILQLKTPALKEVCSSHFQYEDIVEAALSHHDTIQHVLTWLKNYFNDQEVSITLDHDLILEITTKVSEEVHPLIMSKLHFTDDEIKKYQTQPHEDIVITKETNMIDDEFSRKDLTLKEVGIPALHIIRVWANGEDRYVELTKDESFLNFQ